jgi:adenylate kinase
MVCDKCGSALVRRSDDSLEALKLRLQAYYQHEQEVIDFYIDKGLNIEMLNGDQSVQHVFEDFKIVLQKYDY